MNGIFFPKKLEESIFSENEVQIFILLNQVCSGISLFCCSIIVLLFWFFKETRSFILGITLWLCFSEMLYFITAFFPYTKHRGDNPFWCSAQAFMIIMFQTSKLIWGCILGYSSFITAIRKDHLQRHKKHYLIIFLLLAYLVPACLASM